MHSVERSAEPLFFSQLRVVYTDWDHLDGGDRRRIRGTLAQDFGLVCAYCEEDCRWPFEGTIDHFRPRNWFPGQWLDWLNLVLACERCNQAKGGSWPGFDDAQTNQSLGTDSRYMSVSEYVSPNAERERKPAQEYFEFDVETGEIRPAKQLDRLVWSMARRTIWDMDLNDRELGVNHPAHLWSQRLRQRNLLIQRLSSITDPEQMVLIALDFTQPDKPFSTFITAFLAKRFPDLV